MLIALIGSAFGLKGDAMRFSVAFMGIPVANFKAASLWYEHLLGRSPDMIPHDSEAVWQISESGWLYVVQDLERAAGNALLTLIVEDLDAQIAELLQRDIIISEFDERPGTYRKAIVKDPEGNTVEFAEILGENV